MLDGFDNPQTILEKVPEISTFTGAKRFISAVRQLWIDRTPNVENKRNELLEKSKKLETRLNEIVDSMRSEDKDKISSIKALNDILKAQSAYMGVESTKVVLTQPDPFEGLTDADIATKLFQQLREYIPELPEDINKVKELCKASFIENQ